MKQTHPIAARPLPRGSDSSRIMTDRQQFDPALLRTPLNAEATGIPVSLIEDIALRAAISEGRPSTVRLADRLHTSVAVIDAAVQAMRDRRLVEYEGMEGRSYLVSPTETGRDHSRLRSQECRYSGALPVPLELYTAVVRAQVPHVELNREALTRAYSDLVVSPALIDQLGPAICGEGAMFLYGPPGTGKSSIAERMIRAYGDTVLIPHAVEVSGQIVTVYDPILHDPVDDQPEGLDPRWVVCKRPAVIAGGELHAAMLDLALDREVGTYLAPLQFKANNGILVIDDFGRQAMTPEELLNRWIVPLDRQLDYLTLAGRKFAVPFEVKVVLSTNLDPATLGDEAFFRRIHNKIFIGCVDDESFDFILDRITQARGITVDASAAARLRASAKTRGDGELRAYLPGVVCKLAMSISRYENLAPHLDDAMIDRVLDLYFTRTVSLRGPLGADSPDETSEALHQELEATLSSIPPVTEPVI